MLCATASSSAATLYDVPARATTSGLILRDALPILTLTSTGAAATAAASPPTYPITASAASGSGLSNYTITYNPGTLTVTKRPLSITANDASKLYGTTKSFAGTEFAVAASDATSGLVNGDSVNSVSLSSTGAAATAAASPPTYPITASAASGSGLSNYAITYYPGRLTVTKRPLSITADDASKLYGTTKSFAGTEFAVAASDATSGLVNGDSVGSVTLTSTGAAATALVSPPTYPITASAASGSGLSNYTITYNPGTLTVTKRPLTITANRFSKLYGTTKKIGRASCRESANDATSGLVNGERVNSVSLSSTGAAATAAASPPTYPITA